MGTSALVYGHRLRPWGGRVGPYFVNKYQTLPGSQHLGRGELGFRHVNRAGIDYAEYNVYIQSLGK